MQPDSETSLNTVLSNGAKGESAVAKKKEKEKKKRKKDLLVGVWKENTGLAVTSNNDDDSGVLQSLFSKEPLARTLHTEVKKKKNNDYSKSVTFLFFLFFISTNLSYILSTRYNTADNRASSLHYSCSNISDTIAQQSCTITTLLLLTSLLQQLPILYHRVSDTTATNPVSSRL